MTHVPVIPDSAPFTAEQRAWLNGFLAGLFSYAPAQPAPPPAPPAPAQLRPLAILYGSQTGTSQKLARRIAKAAARRGFAPALHELAHVTPTQLAAETHALIVTSTYGDGEPPDNARAFWQALRAPDAPRLERTRYSLCALGDSNYPRFCQFGKDLDSRLQSLGAVPARDRLDCDVDYETPFATWLATALQSLSPTADLGPGAGSVSSVPSASSAPTVSSAPGEAADASNEAGPRWSRERPFPARLSASRRLSSPDSAKDVRHFEIALAGLSLNYEAGDALGVWPANCPDLVRQILDALAAAGDEAVPGRDGSPTPLRLALEQHYDIGRIPVSLIRFFAGKSGDENLARVAAPDANGALTQFQHGRDVLDLLLAHPAIRPSPAEFVALLRKLQPRLYSISSSPKAHPGEVHLTVNAVRYSSLGRYRTGVASCFLADRCLDATPVPVFVHANPAFRPPPPDVPLIMIGPGTGIAPFRAFLQERRAAGNPGRNWLFFGDQHAASDYLYRDDLEAFLRDGTLSRLDLAWSRDQSDKIYVQTRMREAAADLWRWLEEGAAVYVCGDASRMAKDVDAALQTVVEQAGGRTPDAARAYLDQLQAARRYQRDVY